MKGRLKITGHPGDIEIMKTYTDITGRLNVESEELNEDGSVIWILKNNGAEERHTMFELSLKTPLLQYNLTMMKEEKK